MDKTNNSNGQMSAGVKEEDVLFNFGENSGLYFKPKNPSFGRLLNADKVRSAFINDNTKLKDNPYTLEFSLPGAHTKGRGLIVHKNYGVGVPRQYGILNHWDKGIKLAVDQIERIKELAKQGVTQAMSDADLANDR